MRLSPLILLGLPHAHPGRFVGPARTGVRDVCEKAPYIIYSNFIIYIGNVQVFCLPVTSPKARPSISQTFSWSWHLWFQ